MPRILDQHIFESPVVLGPFTVGTLPSVPDGAVAVVTDDPDSPLYTRIAGVWEPANVASSIQREFTQSNITVTVDYDDLSAVDPLPGTIFVNQDEVDDFLVANSATAFKHIEEFYSALPRFVLDTITINLAPGIHRPSTSGYSTSYAFELNHKYVYGFIDFVGAAPSLWTPMFGLTGLSVIAYQSANRDPYIDVSGTPFAGLDLRGRYAVLSTGQTVLIHDHTDSRLYVTSLISPTPVGGTLFVGQPSTVLRNSQDDVATYKTGNTIGIGTGMATTVTSAPGYLLTTAYMRNIICDPFGASSNTWVMQGNRCRLEYCILDQDTAGKPPYNKFMQGNCWQLINRPGEAHTLYLCSKLEKNVGVTGVDGLFYVGTGRGILYGCYFENGEDGSSVTSPAGAFTAYGSVWNSCGRVPFASGGMAMLELGSTSGADFYDVGASGTVGMGKSVEFRNAKAGVATLRFLKEAKLRPDYSRFIIKGCQGPLFILEGGALLDNRTSNPGIIDGGGNTDYGIVFVGGGAQAVIPTAATIAPTLGAVKMKDGTIIASLADVKALGPIVDGTLNIVEKL